MPPPRRAAIPTLLCPCSLFSLMKTFHGLRAAGAPFSLGSVMKTFPHFNELARPGNTRFADRTVLVIGGGQATGTAGHADDPVGNGRAICLQLAAGGARVLCADRSGDAAARTVKDITDHGGSAFALTADIARPEDIRALFDGLAQRGIGIDGLVLNAGISDRRPLRDITPESWDTIFGVNLRGHALC